MFIRRRKHVSVFGNRPEILHHLHRFIEGLVVRRSLAEFLRRQNLRVAGIASKFAPLLLHVFANEPLAKFEAFIALLRVPPNREPFSPQSTEPLSGATARHTK